MQVWQDSSSLNKVHVRGVAAIVVLGALLTGCSKPEPEQTSSRTTDSVHEDGADSSAAADANSNEPRPNVVTPETAIAGNVIECYPKGSTARSASFAKLKLFLPAWYDRVSPLADLPDGPLSDAEVYGYTDDVDPEVLTQELARGSFKMWVEIGVASSGQVASAWVGHSLGGAHDYLAAGCAWAASWAYNYEYPEAPESGFNITHSAYHAGRAYQLAGELGLAKVWLELARTNPRADPDAQYYSDLAESLLED